MLRRAMSMGVGGLCRSNAEATQILHKRGGLQGQPLGCGTRLLRDRGIALGDQVHFF